MGEAGRVFHASLGQRIGWVSKEAGVFPKFRALSPFPPSLPSWPGAASLMGLSGCPLGPRGQVAPHFIVLSRLYSRGWGLCLDDSPTKDVIDFPSIPPGVLYDVGHQCRLQYGAYSAFCDDMDVSVGPVWTRGRRAALSSPQTPPSLGSAHT